MMASARARVIPVNETPASRYLFSMSLCVMRGNASIPSFALVKVRTFMAAGYRRYPMTWLLDLDGVVWLAGRPLPGAADAIGRLQRAGTRVLFFTNNSEPTIAEHLGRLGHAGVDAGAGDI